MDLKIYHIMLNNMINNISNLTEDMPKLVLINFPVYNGIKNFFIFVTTIGAAVVISTALISIIISNERNNHSLLKNSQDIDSDFDEDDEDEDDVDYENKYLDKYSILEDNDLSEDYKGFFIEEKTPRGIVKMNYDPDFKHFNYYSNCKDIPYNYLEIVARLFVVENNCKNIFVDYKQEIDKATKLHEELLLENIRLEEEREESRKKDENKKSSVFAIFKNYNTSTINSEKTENSDTMNNKNNENNKKIILPEKSNTYKYKGKLVDYNEYLDKEIGKGDEFEHLDYTTFKKLSKDLNEKKTL